MTGSARVMPALPGWATGMLLTLGLLAAWQVLVGWVASANGTVPAPSAIARQFWSDGPGFYTRGALHTLKAASLGWLWGNLLACCLALLAIAAPRLARGILQFGIVSFCIPIVAIGPVLTIVFSGDIPRIVLAAMPVFFVTLVGAIAGLRSADRVMLDMVHAFGGRSRDALFKVRLCSALPSLFAALRVAAPSAILGSIVGEFFGAENGLGVILINAQQALNFGRTWAVTLVAGAIAATAYGLTGCAARLSTRWARETNVNVTASLHAMPVTSARSGVLRALRAPASLLISLAMIGVVWWALLKLFAISPFIGKGPFEVWNYLLDSGNRAAIAGEGLISIRDASIGLGAGSAAAILCAVAFTIWPVAERLMIGPALALQSVPLVALAPLIVLIFGRGLGAIAVIGGLIAFFPTLVNVSLALKRTPRQSIDLAWVYGGSRSATLLKIQLPQALPALFASMRVAAPLAMTGALLAEWLATGNGLGYAILNAAAISDYDGLWSRVALVTAFLLAVYRLIGAVENAILSTLR